MPASICPHFGTKLDPETPLAYASPGGRCYRSGKAAGVSTRHQNNYCLSGEHGSCPLLAKQQARTPAPAPKAADPKPAGHPAPAPKNAASRPKPERKAPAPPTPTKRMPAPERPRTAPVAKAAQAPKPAPVPKTPRASQPLSNRKAVDWSKVSLGLYGVLMMFAMVAVLAWGASLAGADLPAVFAARRTPVAPTESETRQAVETERPTAPALPAVISNDIIRGTEAPTRTPIPTEAKPSPTRAAKTRTASRTPAASTQLSAQPTTEVCGPPYGWVRYIVRAGDTLSSLSRAYNTSIYQLQSANCMGSSIQLYAGSAMYVPYYIPPSYPTLTSTTAPTNAPTEEPTEKPTEAPTEAPTEPEPSEEPTTDPPEPEPAVGGDTPPSPEGTSAQS